MALSWSIYQSFLSTIIMKFILFAVVCLFGVAFSAPASTKQKRDILPGDSRYGTHDHLHHHRNHENEFQSASNNYLAPAIDAAQTSASENNAYLAPAATDSVSPAVAEYERPSESVPREVSIRHSAGRQSGHQQVVQNTVIQTAPQSHSSAGHPVHQQTVQNTVIQTAPQTHGSAPQQTVQNTILQSAPQTNGHVKQTVQNTVLQSASETQSSGFESSHNIGDAANPENEVDASEVSQTYGSESSSLSLGQQGESTNVSHNVDLADQQTADAPQTYHYKLIVKHYPQKVKTHVESVNIDDSEAHASQQMTLIGSNGGYVY